MKYLNEQLAQPKSIKTLMLRKFKMQIDTSLKELYKIQVKLDESKIRWISFLYTVKINFKQNLQN